MLLIRELSGIFNSARILTNFHEPVNKISLFLLSPNDKLKLRKKTTSFLQIVGVRAEEPPTSSSLSSLLLLGTNITIISIIFLHSSFSLSLSVPRRTSPSTFYFPSTFFSLFFLSSNFSFFFLSISPIFISFYPQFCS